jgi:hypothetical protein
MTLIVIDLKTVLTHMAHLPPRQHLGHRLVISDIDASRTQIAKAREFSLLLEQLRT